MNPGNENTLWQRFYITRKLWKKRPSTRRLDWRHSAESLISVAGAGKESRHPCACTPRKADVRC